MIFLSTIVVAAIIGGFWLNGDIPFDKPVSLLIEGPHPWAYHAILVSLMGVLAWHVLAISRTQNYTAAFLSYPVLIVLLLLLFVDYRVQPAHDMIAVSLLFLASIYLFSLCADIHNWLLKSLVYLPFFSLPLVFTHRLEMIAWVECLVLISSLVLLNVFHYRSTDAPRVSPALAVELLRYGSRLRGYLWACLSVFVAGISGVYADAPYAGVLHFALCWLAGYLSKHFEVYPVLESAFFFVSGFGFVLGLGGFATVGLDSMMLPLFFTFMFVLSFQTFRKMMELAEA